MNKKNYCVLLTACINPLGAPFLKRNDSRQREKDYIISLSNWLKHKKTKIVFCENSGYDLSKIKNTIENIGHTNLEILQFCGNENVTTRGKGYSEMVIIEYALANSRFINDSSYILKVSGRNYIENFHLYEKWLDNKKEAFINVNLHKNLRFADSRFFGFKKEFFQRYLLKYKELINDFEKVWIEHVLVKATLQAIIDGYIWEPLPYLPRLNGFSASSDYKIRQQFHRYLRSVVRHKLYRYLIAK
jgi:hypothetical protein